MRAAHSIFFLSLIFLLLLKMWTKFYIFYFTTFASLYFMQWYQMTMHMCSCPALFISINNINTPSETTNVESLCFFYNFSFIFYIKLCKNGATVGHLFFLNFIFAKQILSRHPQQARKLSWLNTKGVCWVGFMVNIITFDWIKLRFMFQWTKKNMFELL